MQIAYCGNFDAEHSTENEVRRALENNGHTVHQTQEGMHGRLGHLIDAIPTGAFDLILWTRTKGLAERVDEALYWKMLATARQRHVPVVGYHLDRWWGLKRQAEIELDPFFRVDLLCTADGGHDDEWESVGVNHAWFPPAISERNCYLGTPREEYASDIAFVGSWEGGYHDEDTHRPALIQWLRGNYSQRVKFWPRHGEHAIRGPALNDLYASVKVVVGTSCLVPNVKGEPMTHYCSDRIPETLGRGGILFHPSVEGIDKLYGDFFPYDLDDLDALGGNLDDILRVYDKTVGWLDGNQEGMRRRAIAGVRENHTYEVRVRQLVDLLNDRGMR